MSIAIFRADDVQDSPPVRDPSPVPKAPFPADRAAAGLIVGESAAIRRVLEQVRHVAATDSTVLLLGETGTGKEVIAACLHALSARRDRAMVRVNCSAFPPALMESELFGREKGAYTGAVERQIGRFELAHHSTIFLDEIGDLPADTQVKLLRVLEERQFERLGSPRAIRVDTRVIAATHRDLEQGIATGTFREDSVLPIERLSHPRAAASGPARGHSSPGVALRRGILEAVRQARRGHHGREHVGAPTVRLAGEHPRASECCRARDGPGDRTAPDHCPARGTGGRAPAQRYADRRHTRAHSRRARERRLANPRGGWRRPTAWAQAHHARDAHGEARAHPPSACTVLIR